MLVSLIVGTVVGVLLGLDVTQSIFLAACLTFSSTPIILQFIHSEGIVDRISSYLKHLFYLVCAHVHYFSLKTCLCPY